MHTWPPPRLWGVLAALALGACGSLTTQGLDSHPPKGPPQSLAVGVRELAQPVIDRGETPGLVVGVQTSNGPPQFFEYGSGESSGEPLSANSLFPIGSLNKGFVGALLSVLVDEGFLRWEEPLQELLPDITLSPDAARITLLQLATHSAGLPRQPFDLGLLVGLGRFVFGGENFYNRMDQAYLVRFLETFQAPQQRLPQYSNIGYALIGWAIEARTGAALPELLKTKVLAPLGLHNTGFDPDALPARAHRALGHAGDQPKFIPRGQPVPDWQFIPSLRGAAGLYSTAQDLLTFANAHLCGMQHPHQCNGRLHQLLADNLRVRIQQPQDAPGIAWVTDQFDDLALVNQVGMAVGHTSYVGLDVLHGNAAVVLQTSFNWNFKVGHVLLQRLARGQIHPPQLAPEASTSVSR